MTYLIGKDRAWVLVEEYDTKILIPLLVVVFRLLNPDDEILLPQEPNLVLDDSLFGVIASTKETNERLLKTKLSLFCHIVVLEENMKSPFAWWKKHECQFSNVGFDLI